MEDDLLSIQSHRLAQLINQSFSRCRGTPSLWFSLSSICSLKVTEPSFSLKVTEQPPVSLLKDPNPEVRKINLIDGFAIDWSGVHWSLFPYITWTRISILTSHAPYRPNNKGMILKLRVWPTMNSILNCVPLRPLAPPDQINHKNPYYLFPSDTSRG